MIEISDQLEKDVCLSIGSIIILRPSNNRSEKIMTEFARCGTTPQLKMLYDAWLWWRKRIRFWLWRLQYSRENWLDG